MTDDELWPVVRGAVAVCELMFAATAPLMAATDTKDGFGLARALRRAAVLLDVKPDAEGKAETVLLLKSLAEFVETNERGVTNG